MTNKVVRMNAVDHMVEMGEECEFKPQDNAVVSVEIVGKRHAEEESVHEKKAPQGTDNPKFVVVVLLEDPFTIPNHDEDRCEGESSHGPSGLRSGNKPRDGVGPFFGKPKRGEEG